MFPSIHTSDNNKRLRNTSVLILLLFSRRSLNAEPIEFFDTPSAADTLTV